MVGVRGWGMYCVYKRPHKDRQDILVEHVRETVVVINCVASAQPVL